MNYSIGLDIGTNSVGWACISEDFKILKYNNKYAIGVHEFEGAKVAADRRVKRGTRRRYNRRKKRIYLLQQLFIEPMSKNYPSFFKKNDKEHFWKNNNEFENKTLSETLRKIGANPNIYPTVYHLRNDLIYSSDQADLRLIYLAIHNLVKYRGHFLNENLKWSGNRISTDFISQLEYLLEKYNELIQHYSAHFTAEMLQYAQNILMDTQKTKKDRSDALKKLLGREYEPLFKLLLGLKVNCDKLFPFSENLLSYKESKKSLIITSEEFEAEIEQLTEVEIEFLEYVTAYYQQLVLSDLLGNHSCIASAKVESYEIFKNQLLDLRYIVDKYAQKEYKNIFITVKKNLVLSIFLCK